MGKGIKIKKYSTNVNKSFRDAYTIFKCAYPSDGSRILAVITVLSFYLAIFPVVSMFCPKDTPPWYIMLISFLWCGEAFLIVVSIISMRAASRLLEEKNKLLEEEKIQLAQTETPQFLQELDAKFFGISQRHIIVECALQAEGYSIRDCKHRVVAMHDGIDSIEHTLSNPHADPTGKIELNAKGSRMANVELIPEILKVKDRALLWRMRFLPSLKKGQTVDYFYNEVGIKGSFAMNFKEMELRELKREFMSLTISYPTQYLRYKLTFPEKYTPLSYGFEVWLGEGEVKHKPEMLRLEQEEFFKDDLNGNKLVLELKVKCPIHGLRYAIVWVPPKN